MQKDELKFSSSFLSTPLPCDPAMCPSLIGYVTYEYLTAAGQQISPTNSLIYTHIPCKYSNIILDSTGQRTYLVLDRAYRFPGDPTERLGQFLIELAPNMTGCRYPVAYLRDYYPFDQNVPDYPITKVGQTYQQTDNPLLAQIPTPTPTVRRLFNRVYTD